MVVILYSNPCNVKFLPITIDKFIPYSIRYSSSINVLPFLLIVSYHCLVIPKNTCLPDCKKVLKRNMNHTENP